MNDKLGSLNYINSLSISQNGAMLVMTSFGKVYELMDHYGACNKLSISECFPVSYHASHDSRLDAVLTEGAVFIMEENI